MTTLAKYREALDELSDDASEEEARAALVAAGLVLTPPAGTPVAAAAVPGTIVLASSVWEQTQKDIKVLTDFAARTKRDERDEVIGKAVQAGKFTPAQRTHFATMWDSNPDATRALIDALTPNSALAVMASGYAGEASIEADELDREIDRLSPPRGKAA